MLVKIRTNIKIMKTILNNKLQVITLLPSYLPNLITNHSTLEIWYIFGLW